MPIRYPQARKDAVVDDYFGIPVADPYRWMEDPQAPELRAYIDAQNAITRAYLDAIPERERIQARLAALHSSPQVAEYGQASRRGAYYFYAMHNGHDQAVLYRREGVNGEPHIVLDPNAFTMDGAPILMQTVPDPTGTLLSYSISRGGSDWQEFFVRNLQSGQDLPDHLAWCKFTTIAWKADSSGFYYNRFPEPQPGQEKLAENLNCRIYFHRIGTSQAEDVLVFENPAAPHDLYWPTVTDDGRWLLLEVRRSAAGETGYICWRIDSDEDFVRLLDDFDAIYQFVGSQDDTLIFTTNLDAPHKRVVAVDVANPSAEHWREIVPEQADTLETAHTAGGQLVACYMHNAQTQMKTFTLGGDFLQDIPLPAPGTVPTYRLETDAALPDFLFTFMAFLHPLTIFRYDTTTASVEVFQKSQVPVKPDNYETRQVFYPSTGGVQVSMFITHRKGLALDGQNPTLLYAYGGFDIPILPAFDAANYVWLEGGGVYAVANLRGGGEYGAEWHKDGMLSHKQHVFDDMLNAAEWLIDSGYTAPGKLAIRGASNGGLLVSACMTQRPDLFGAVLCGVPVTDMLRYHRFTAGRLWVSEYGSAEDSPEAFETLLAYSPLHNVHEGTAYPPTLIWTSDGDDRVVPMHSLKFAATLQAADGGQNPLLLRFGTQAGHGTLTMNKIIEEESDFFGFLAAALGWSAGA
ncbi:MAG: S9 family peptidase [Anaerolineae bacterium]|nr:S9 family peptidase [Anaerolineae bacterium]